MSRLPWLQGPRTVPGMEQRSGEQQTLLNCHRRPFVGAGAKDQEIRATFGIGVTTYYRHLNAPLDREAALAPDPVLVNRLRRRRVANQRSTRTRPSAVRGG